VVGGGAGVLLEWVGGADAAVLVALLVALVLLVLLVCDEDVASAACAWLVFV
jgi:hypothetical protein